MCLTSLDIFPWHIYSQPNFYWRTAYLMYLMISFYSNKQKLSRNVGSLWEICLVFWLFVVAMGPCDLCVSLKGILRLFNLSALCYKGGYWVRGKKNFPKEHKWKAVWQTCQNITLELSKEMPVEFLLDQFLLPVVLQVCSWPWIHRKVNFHCGINFVISFMVMNGWQATSQNSMHNLIFSSSYLFPMYNS